MNQADHDGAATKSRLEYLLYTSHALSTWNARLFEFGAILFLASLYPGTLLPVSIYAMCSAAPGTILAPVIGRFIDTAERLSLVRWSIICQRLTVVISCVLFIRHWSVDWWLLGALSVFGGIENASSLINTVAVERDWVVVIAANDRSWLSKLNAGMRFIDLFCKLVGPFCVGLIDGYNTKVAAATVLSMSMVSLGFEYFAIARVYKAVPDLARKPSHDEEEHDVIAPKVSYWSHPMLLPSLALSMLYITVLSFSGQMVAFLLACGMSPETVTVFRTASTVVELTVTVIAPRVTAKLGPVYAGTMFLYYQWLTLLVTAIFFFKLSSPVVLSIGVMLSRLGLWGFDLSAQIIIQEGVQEIERGSFSMTEKGLQNLAVMIVYLSTMVFHRPDQFKWPISMSIVSVGCAALLFTIFMRRQRSVRIDVN